MIKYFLLVSNDYWLYIHLQREENIISNKNGFPPGKWITVRSSVGHWHQSNDYSSWVPAQHSHTHGHSAGGHALTPLITGSAPTRAYLINRSVPPLPHTLSPHLQHLYFYAHFKLHYLTTDNLKGSSLPHQVSDQGNTAQSLLFLSHRHCSPAAQKADPRERWQLSWALGGECEGHELPEPPSTLVSQVFRLLQRTQRCCGDQNPKGATNPSREKHLSSVYIRFS